MKCKFYLDSSDPYYKSLTKSQWKKLGRVVNDDAKGKELLANYFNKKTTIYYTESETHLATPQEKEIWKLEQAERNKIKRKRQMERRKQDVKCF